VATQYEVAGPERILSGPRYSYNPVYAWWGSAPNENQVLLVPLIISVSQAGGKEPRFRSVVFTCQQLDLAYFQRLRNRFRGRRLAMWQTPVRKSAYPIL